MDFYCGGLVIGSIFASKILGEESLFSGVLFFWGGGGGEGGGGGLSEFYSTLIPGSA